MTRLLVELLKVICFVVYSQPASLKQLVNLYVGRCFSCWKIPECIAWLEENVQAVCAIGLSDFKRSVSSACDKLCILPTEILTSHL